MSDTVNRFAIQCFTLGTERVKEKCQDLSQEESLNPMGFGHNCVNWTIGHMLKTRKFLLGTLGDHSFTWTDKDDEAYGDADTVEEAAQKAAGGRSLEQLLEDLDTTLGLLKKALEEKDLRSFEGQYPFFRGQAPVHEIASFLIWHEGTHVGEISVLCEALRN